AGRGGMGVVWRVRDEELGETLALKFLPEVVARDPVAVDKLKEETRRARRLRHPNIVQVFDFVRDDAMAAVSMEFVAGTTVGQQRLAQPGKVFTAAKLAPLVAQLCAALDYAHQQAKIVHRDLKPANLLVTNDGQLKVADFGIARSLTETHTRLTNGTGGTSGTLLYMSPQQLMGEKPAAADDIYALGSTLYELLTGKPPFFRGEATAMLLQIREKKPLPLAEQCAELGTTAEPVPPEWEEAILACLEKDPLQRPQSAGEFLRRLEPGAAKAVFVKSGTDRAEGKTTKGAAPVVANPSSSAPAKRKGVMPLLAAAALVVLGGLGYYYGIYAPARARRAEEAQIEEQKKNAAAEQERQQRVQAAAQAAAQEAAAKEAAARAAAEKEAAAKEAAQTAALAGAQRQARILTLLDTARAADKPETAALALDTLNRVLELEPGNADALALKHKVEAYPRTLKVPGAYPSLAAALGQARPGDTVELAAGIFPLRTATLAGGVNLRGAGMDATTIRQERSAPGEPPSVLVITGAQQTVQVADLTVEMTGSSNATIRNAPVLIKDSKAELQRVRMRNSIGHGMIVSDNAGVKLTSCSFENNAWAGLLARGAGTSVTAEACTSESNANNGFSIWEGATAQINNSTSRRNGGNGFQVISGGGATFTGNTAADNKRSGFALGGEGSRVQLTDNESRGNAYPNFEVSDHARVRFQNNRALDGLSLGFHVEGATTYAEFQGDQATGNKTGGFAIYDGATAIITGAIARGNLNSGFAFHGKPGATAAAGAQGSHGTLKNVQSIDNQGYGLIVRDGARVSVAGATIRGNKFTGIYNVTGSTTGLQGGN
ncbi:MAG: protein kinase, partial [Pseudomonadota bacterium]